MKIKAATRQAVLFATVALLATVFFFSSRSYGAEEKVITSLSITFKDVYGEAEVLEPEITAKVNGAELTEIIWAKDIDDWSPGKKVRATLVFSSDEKIFANSYTRSECKVTGAIFATAKADDNYTLVVKVDYLPVVTLGFTDRAGWSSQEKTKAVWNKVEFATGYQLNLYADNKRTAKVTVDTNYADLSQYIKDADANYYYEVRAIGYTSNDKKYRKEGAYVSSEDTYFDNLGDISGQWRNGQYKQEDGEYVTNAWKMISGKWYYFDGNGTRMTGWINPSGKWYYLSSDGIMSTGWLNLGDKWYYLNTESGEMMIGWVEINPGVWYYFNIDGSMAVNTWIGNYRVDANGVWVQ